MTSRLSIVILGMMGKSPFAGVAWQVAHYVEGLRRLGHDVFYVEDTGAWPYDPIAQCVTGNPSYTVAYLERELERIGMTGRWAYRSTAENGKIYGCATEVFDRAIANADVLINVTGATVLREEHHRIPVRIYLETDPVLPQIQIDQGRAFTIDLLRGHTHHFTFGENIGTSTCPLPTGEFEFIPTRQPIVLDWWQRDSAPTRPLRFTTIASWQQSGKDVVWNGNSYAWSKHHEFLKLIELPRRVATPLELSLAAGEKAATPTFPGDVDRLKARGWRVSDALKISGDTSSYQQYILESAAEFTVAKEQNTRLSSGWFSDRSATYLAAGKPVVTQDTAFSSVLPVGRGLFSFRTEDEAVTAIDAILADYEGNSRAALEISREYFDAERVVGNLLTRAGV